MVSNYDRILTEIKEEAQRSAPEHNIHPDALVGLARCARRLGHGDSRP